MSDTFNIIGMIASIAGFLLSVFSIIRSNKAKEEVDNTKKEVLKFIDNYNFLDFSKQIHSLTIEIGKISATDEWNKGGEYSELFSDLCVTLLDFNALKNKISKKEIEAIEYDTNNLLSLVQNIIDGNTDSMVLKKCRRKLNSLDQSISKIISLNHLIN